AGYAGFANITTAARAAAPQTPKPAAIQKTVQPQDTPGGQLRMLDDKGNTTGYCPLERTEVRADVAGFVARVNVRQRFSNPSSKPIEAIYTFPLPDDAAVDSMTMSIGRERIVGQIKRREKAREIYNAAKSAGKTASLLDQERDNIFTQSIANIMPGETVIIDISYANMLVYDEGAYEWSFPTVVGPRYTPTGGYTVPGQRGEASTPGDESTTADAESTTADTDGDATKAVVTDAEKITPPIAPQGTRAGHDITLEVNLDAGVPLQDVTSRLHPIVVQRVDARRARIRLADAATLPNKDFILHFKTAAPTVKTGVVAHAPGKGKGSYFSLILQPPAVPDSVSLTARDIVFVIDQTGSQSGLPIRKAKEVMSYLIKNMNPGDEFQLLGFNTSVYPCFPSLVNNTPGNVSKALKWLEPIEGSGGTDILRAAEYVLNIPVRPGRQRLICYLTDGFIGNESQVIAYVKKNRGRAKLFPFGMGNSVNRMLIDGLARAGNGIPEYVDLNKRGENVAAQFYRRVARPLLTDIRVQWKGVTVSEIFPTPVPDLFMAGRPVIFKGRYAKGGDGTAIITGKMNGKPYRQEIKVSLPDNEPGGSALASIWAREKIAVLQDREWYEQHNGGGDAAATREAIIQTALDY
ncbi:MAG TPA: VIT and VWA domain-containing protein, partial [Abditibacteriaceae bacterium]